jgi:Gpi18-like mannosyltransferase
MKLTMAQIVVIGIVVRLVLAVYTQHAATWAKVTHFDELLLLGSNPLVRATSFGVGFYFFYTFVYMVFWLMSTALSIHYEFVMNILFRVPPLIGDVVSMYSLYIIAQRITNQKTALILAAAYFLNPYTIWISAIVGHAESLMMGFVLLSIVYLDEGRLKKSAFILAFATAFRHLPLLLLPFFLYYVHAKKQGTKKYLGIYLLSSVALAVPYIVSIFQMYSAAPSSLFAFFDHWIGSGSAVQGTGSYGIVETKGFTFNFTGIIATLGFWGDVGPLLGFRNFLLVYPLFVILLVRRGAPNAAWLSTSTVITFSVLLIFTPLVQHHYLMWVFPFLLLAAYVTRELPKFVPIVIGSVTLLIDMVIEGSFFYYLLSVFPIQASKLQGSWLLRDTLIQLGLSAVEGLSIVFVISFLLLRNYKTH